MIVRQSFDPEVLKAARGEYIFEDEKWLATPGNIMAVYGEDVGLATFDYQGLYTIHWFFKSRGKEALIAGKALLQFLFDNTDAVALRGLTAIDNRPARRLAKYFGFETISIEEFWDGPHEVMILYKDVFNCFKETI